MRYISKEEKGKHLKLKEKIILCDNIWNGRVITREVTRGFLRTFNNTLRNNIEMEQYIFIYSFLHKGEMI